MDAGDAGNEPADESLDRALRLAYSSPGKTLGSWRLESEIGSGAMGRVYLARPRRDTAGVPAGTAVALKVIHPHLLGGVGFFKRFLREAEIGSLVRHENVVRILDCDAARLGGETLHFIVMEYVEGRTLRAVLEEHGRLPEALCRVLGREVARGLAAIHAAGVVHRDLKPENVLLTRDHRVRVMDLGVARLVEEVVRLSATGSFVGSVSYAAPEQFTGEGGDLDTRADLFSLGVVLHEAAAGAYPFPGRTFRQVLREVMRGEPPPLGDLRPEISPFFEEVVRALLARNRDERFAGAEEVAEILARGEATSLRRPCRPVPRTVAVPPAAGGPEDAGALPERVAALEGDVRALLAAAARIGMEFDPLEAAAAAGIPEIPALLFLTRLERRDGLVCPSGPSFRFASPAAREASRGARG